jgi:hypothetical protein
VANNASTENTNNNQTMSRPTSTSNSINNNNIGSPTITANAEPNVNLEAFRNNNVTLSLGYKNLRRKFTNFHNLPIIDIMNNSTNVRESNALEDTFDENIEQPISRNNFI